METDNMLDGEFKKIIINILTEFQRRVEETNKEIENQ